VSLKVKYYSLCDGNGYGASALAYMNALMNRGVQIKWSPLVNTRLGLAPRELLKEGFRPSLLGVSKRQDRLAKTVDIQLDYTHVIMHIVPELYPKLREEGKHNIAYTVWETDALPKHWPELLQSADSLMVPCEFNVPLFAVGQGPEVTKVPHLLTFDEPVNSNERPLRAEFRRRNGIADKDTLFVNLSALCPRKAVLETLTVYLDSFTAADDVCLLLKTDAEIHSRRGKGGVPTKDVINELLATYTNPPSVVLLDHHLSDQDLRAFYESGDCYFSLTHSEGWGLGLYSAAQLGMPIICTGWGGQLDFLHSEHTFLVNYSMIAVETVRGWESYSLYQNWAQADAQHAKQRLWEVYNDLDAARVKGAALRKYVIEEFSNERIINKMLAAIDA
jgi:glycosyltransferase involved in cell wall biosynthesis